MFCKRTHCALILMMDAALAYSKKESINVKSVAEKHTIPFEIFEDVVARLLDSKLIFSRDGDLSLQVTPDKITIWQIVVSISGGDVFTGRYYDDNHQVAPTSAIIMLNKERENVLRILENRLGRQKLSVWSEKAGRTVYI